MQNTPPVGAMASAVGHVADEFGYALVECADKRVKQTLHVHCVVDRPGGVSLDDLAVLHRAVLPLVREIDEDAHVEFSSPGLTREIKSFHEFALFVGRQARVWISLDGAEPTVHEGVVRIADQPYLELTTGEHIELQPDRVQKARLNDV